MNASLQVMPAQRYAKKQTIEMLKYTAYSAFAVSAMRGVSFVSFSGPAVSALNACAPPTPSSGRIATASTRMPMPPSQTRRQRQTLIDSGS